MRKDSSDQVADAARRRLELLRRELSSVGLAPREPPVSSADDLEPTPVGMPVLEAGRHLRRSDSTRSRLLGWVEDRLPSTLRGRVRVGSRELVVVLVVAALGLVAAAVLTLRSGATQAIAPLPVIAPTATPTAGGSASALVDPVGLASGPTTAATGSVTVDVAGRVRHPGVLTLPAGSRVADALRRAGGARPHVDLTPLNLARVLTDGEQVLVGRNAMPSAGAAAAQAGGAPAGPMVNLNTASEQQLEQLPGVGPVTAQKILAWRQAHGSFSSVDELTEVDGIGPKTLADLAPYATL